MRAITWSLAARHYLKKKWDFVFYACITGVRSLILGNPSEMFTFPVQSRSFQKLSTLSHSKSGIFSTSRTQNVGSKVVTAGTCEPFKVDSYFWTDEPLCCSVVVAVWETGRMHLWQRRRCARFCNIISHSAKGGCGGRQKVWKAFHAFNLQHQLICLMRLQLWCTVRSAQLLQLSILGNTLNFPMLVWTVYYIYLVQSLHFQCATWEHRWVFPCNTHIPKSLDKTVIFLTFHSLPCKIFSPADRQPGHLLFRPSSSFFFNSFLSFIIGIYHWHFKSLL